MTSKNFRKTNIGLLVLSLLAMISCQPKKLNVDVSAIKVDMTLNRFDQDLFNPKSEGTLQQISFLRKKYPVFFDLFCQRIISAEAPNDSLLARNLHGFITDPNISEVQVDCEKKYGSLSDIKTGIDEAFRHYKYYFPKEPLPEILTFISGFNYAVITSDSLLAISLDMYLGSDCKYYKPIGLPMYKIKRMRKEFMVADCMKAIAQTEFEQSDVEQKDLLAQMIYNGKQFYFIDAMLPNAPDTIKTGYTAVQLNWCSENESNIWAYFIERKLLFSANPEQYFKYVSDGPNTNGLPKESPARLACWTGWQIVKAYMDKNTNVSLAQLMQEKDAQKILNLSKYKPKK